MLTYLLVAFVGAVLLIGFIYLGITHAGGGRRHPGGLG